VVVVEHLARDEQLLTGRPPPMPTHKRAYCVNH
jgi:hypothetical protein